MICCQVDDIASKHLFCRSGYVVSSRDNEEGDEGSIWARMLDGRNVVFGGC